MGSGYPGSCETSDKFCVVGGGISRLELIRRIANYVCRFTRRLVRILSVFPIGLATVRLSVGQY